MDLMTEAEQFLEANHFKLQRAYGYQHFKDYDSQIELRQQFSARFGLAILDTRTLNLVRSFSPLLEVGSGSGYWAHELRKAGADIIPTDPGTGKYYFVHGQWMEMEKLTAPEAVIKYPDRTLLIVWPDFDKPWPHKALAAYCGEVVLYVGEGRDGCTGDDHFHDILDADYECENHYIPQFMHIHDRLYVCRRKKA
jgi:hypothetical protein